jgi:hypothetical protein
VLEAATVGAGQRVQKSLASHILLACVAPQGARRIGRLMNVGPLAVIRACAAAGVVGITRASPALPRRGPAGGSACLPFAMTTWDLSGHGGARK